MRSKLLLAMAVLVLTTGFAQAGPSFRCNRGGLTADEITICSYPQLGLLDRRVANLWRSLSKRDRNALRGIQRQWMGERASCGYDAGCIEQVYYSWIEDLESR